MSVRWTVIAALLGSLIVLLSQVVFAYTLDDGYGFALTSVTLLSKHGPAISILAALAGLAGVFVLTVLSRAPEESNRTALVSGIVISGAGLAVVLVFLLVDLPDVGSTGMYDAPGAGNLDVTGSATGGLWMELVGGLVLLLAGIALALAGRNPARRDEPKPERGTSRSTNGKPDHEESP